MSGILGIVNLDGKPVAAETLAEMLKAMSFWGPNGQGVWLEGAVGLGHLMLHNTPESIHETMPLVSRCKRYVISCRARIDNREELLKLFTVPPDKHRVVPDSTLVLESYIKWGEKCVHHLYGDFVFAIFDCREKSLFIARDHQGTTGLYYYHGSGFFAFSSGLKGLLALREIPIELNEQYIARTLVSWQDHGNTTAYENILRLPPAHAVSINRKAVKIRRYWYLEDVPLLRLKSDNDYLDAFLEIYREAVRCRLRSAGGVGLTLSGGLDSGSVAALAAPELAKQGRSLKAFSSVSIYDSQAGMPKNRIEETPLIKATAGYVKNIDLNLIRAIDKTPLQGINMGLELHDEPFHAAANQFWIFSLWEEAQKQGVNAMLTGAQGNYTVSWNGRGYLAQLARQLRWIRLFREIRGWRTTHTAPLSTLLKQQILMPLIPLGIKRSRRRLRGGYQFWESHSAINIGFLEEVQLLKEMRKQKFDLIFSLTGNCRELRYKGIKPGRSIFGCLMQQNGAGFSLDLRDPTMDRKLLEFCLSIPDHQYLRDGTDRFLIRRAMNGLLPDEVRLNRKRGLQASDRGARVLKNIGEIKSALHMIERESSLANRILDIKRMWAVIKRLENEVNFETLRMVDPVLLRGLTAGLFLHRFETGKPEERS